jgi:hypothetical protein
VAAVTDRCVHALAPSRRSGRRVVLAGAGGGEVYFKLERRFVERLMNLPESGMGYQRVDLRLADGRELRDVPVFNAEDANVPDEFADATITDVRLHAA